MTNAELIQKIRTEIERLKNYAEESKKEWAKEGYNQNAFAEDCRISSFDKLLSFLSTLESEKPMQEGLEEEIGAYFKDWYVDESDQGYSLKTPTGSAVMGHMKNVARHFAQWGYLRAAEKYNEIEYNRQRAEEEMPLPEDTVLFNKGVAEGKRLAEEELSDLLTIAHLQGADQMKDQMLKDAVEGVIEEVSFNNGEQHNTIRFSFDEESLHVENRIWMPRCGKDGDKVRVIVCKKED